MRIVARGPVPGKRILLDDLIVLEVDGFPASATEFSMSVEMRDDSGHAYFNSVAYGIPPSRVFRSCANFNSRPMELFENVKCGKSRPGTRLSQKNVFAPQTCELVVECQGSEVCSKVQRWYASEQVVREDVRTESGLVGTAFRAPDNDPNVVVLDMFGTGGGLIEYKAALIASRGFDCVHVGLFNVGNLPKSWPEIDLNYLEKFLWWAKNKYPGRSVVLHGMSMGGQLAVCAAAMFPDLVQGLVCVNGSPALFDPFKYKGKVLGNFEMDVARAKPVEDADGNFSHLEVGHVFSHVDVERQAQILGPKWPFAPVNEISCPILLIDSVYDANWPSHAFANAFKRLMNPHTTDLTVLELEHAGHLLEPRYGAQCVSVFHNVLGVVVAQGGDVGLHAQDFQTAWESTLGFFEKTARRPRL